MQFLEAGRRRKLACDETTCGRCQLQNLRTRGTGSGAKRMAAHGRFRVFPSVGCLAVRFDRRQSGGLISEAADRRRPDAALRADGASVSNAAESCRSVQCHVHPHGARSGLTASSVNGLHETHTLRPIATNLRLAVDVQAIPLIHLFRIALTYATFLRKT